MERILRRVLLAALGVLLLSVPPALAAPAAPVLSGSVGNSSSLSEAASVAVSGSYAYTTAYEGGMLTAVDISNPLAPVVTGSSAVATSLFGGATVNIAGGYAYVVSKNRNASTSSNDNGDGNSLTILDIHTNPAVPAIVGTLHDPVNLFGAYGVAVSGSHAYVAAQGLLGGTQPQVPDTSTGSFSVIDVSNPASPSIVPGGHLDNGSLPSPWTGTNALQHVTSVFVSGNYAYLTAFNSNRLTIIDISNPASPKIVSSLPDNTQLNSPADVAVSGNYAYVADQTTGSTQATFTVVDVSNPASPHVVGSIIGQDAVMAGAYRVRVRGSLAYVSAANANTVSAIDISNPASPRVVGSVTSNSLYRTLGLDFSPAGGGYVIADSALQPGDPNPTYPPYTPSLTTGTIAAIQLDPVPIAVTIAPASEPPSATTQTTASFTFSTSDQIATVQCQLDGAALGNCTSPTTEQYSALGVGSHTFTVLTTDALGTTATDSYTWSVETAPANTARPMISGTATVGTQLSASNGTWSGSPAPMFGYQWQRCDVNGANCSAITNATAQTYTPVTADAGSTLDVIVTGTNGVGSSTGTSPATAVVTQAPANSALPVISGTATVGSQLSASNGTWSGVPAPTFAYQWRRCDVNGANCSAISGASASGQTYTPVTADAGSTLDVIVTASNSAGSSSASSATTGVVAGLSFLSAPSNVSAPVISGASVIGHTVSCTQGAWTGSAPISYTYSWTRDGTAIAGATRATYLITSADARHRLACSVRASNVTGSVAAASAPLPAPTGRGTIGRLKLLSGGAISVTATCASVAGTICHLSLIISVTESFNGKKLIAVTAAKKTSKVVVLASASFTLGAGAHKTIKLTLSPAGKKLLKTYHRLTVKLALAEAGSNRQSITASTRVLHLA